MKTTAPEGTQVAISHQAFCAAFSHAAHSLEMCPPATACVLRVCGSTRWVIETVTWPAAAVCHVLAEIASKVVYEIKAEDKIAPDGAATRNMEAKKGFQSGPAKAGVQSAWHQQFHSETRTAHTRLVIYILSSGPEQLMDARQAARPSPTTMRPLKKL